MFTEDSNSGRLIYTFDAEQLWIEAWSPNALRIRATKHHTMPEENWALLDTPKTKHASPPEIQTAAKGATFTHGKIKASVSSRGKLMIHNDRGALLLEEYVRNRSDVTDPKCSALEVEAREFRPIVGGDYRLTARFESVNPREKLYGMGQYQQSYLDLKGVDLELAHRNSQASVPFMLSSEGYGFLWNNPSVGRAVLGKNIMSFEASSTKALDYWIVAGDTPAEIMEAYAGVTGTVPMMPEYGLGFWQSKLRYQTQEELLSIAREYKKRELPLDVIVADFFHWPAQGEWKFDPTYWPDPDAMIKELKEMNIDLMVSIWPTVDSRSENYAEMLEKGLLIRTERGFRLSMDFMGNTVHFDATNPKARDYVWNTAKKNYYDKGVRIFWLDEAEPEYSVYDFDNYRYHLGSDLAIGNIYPREYARAFYEGQEAAGQTDIVNLLRCAWAGSQRYGALVWSGDIASSWLSFQHQVRAGLSMGIAGIPWWTTDIGGFHGGDPTDPEFQELFVRWFQYGAFCPVMRLHGDREPRQPQHGSTGGAACCSGADNEVWSYGERAYEIAKKYLNVREKMRPYVRRLMQEAHEKGTPIMRPCFFDFPDDMQSWEVEDQYMFGPTYLVCPVLSLGQTKRRVYLPKSARWKLSDDSENDFEGGQTIEVDCPLESMPVFIKQ
jgi:alpha-D-xyloside xylohydrolase